MKNAIPFLDLSQFPKELKYALEKKFSEMLDKGIFSGGEEVDLLERNLCDFLNNPFVVPCANGTDALEIALMTLGIGPGDEVIVPALTWVSTAEAVILSGAKLVFVDTEENGLMDIFQVQKLIRPQTKALLPVHLYGKMMDMEKLMGIAMNAELHVVEDVAQAFGASLNGKFAGTWGDIGCFSFYPTKNLGALGEAGALSAKDKGVANKIRLFTNHGQESRDYHLMVGRNSRIDSIQAGFLNVKMMFWKEWQQRRKKLAGLYLDNLQGLPDIKLPENILSSDHNAHLFVISSQKRDDLKNHLWRQGIGTAIHYPTIVPKIKPYDDGLKYPIAEKLSRESLSLPLNPFLNESEIVTVCNCIRGFYQK